MDLSQKMEGRKGEGVEPLERGGGQRERRHAANSLKSVELDRMSRSTFPRALDISQGSTYYHEIEKISNSY